MPRPEQISDPELRQLVISTQEYMRKGEANEAVNSIIDAMYRLLEVKPELVTEKLEPRPGWKVPFLTRMPQLGANWTKGSLEKEAPKIEFVRDRFALSEAITYYEFVLETAIKRGA